MSECKHEIVSDMEGYSWCKLCGKTERTTLIERAEEAEARVRELEESIREWVCYQTSIPIEQEMIEELEKVEAQLTHEKKVNAQLTEQLHNQRALTVEAESRITVGGEK